MNDIARMVDVLTVPVPKPIHIIVACAENRVMGRDGKLPWRIPEELQFFHTQTAGKICILGRVCFETWPSAARDGRRPIVVTRHQALANPAVAVVGSFQAALAVAETLPGEIYVCGGERIYVEALALVGSRPVTLHLTLVHAALPGDRFFPEWRHLGWHERERRESADANFRYTFFTLEA